MWSRFFLWIENKATPDLAFLFLCGWMLGMVPVVIVGRRWLDREVISEGDKAMVRSRIKEVVPS